MFMAMSENEAKQKENFASKYGKLFLTVLTIFSIAFGIFLCCANQEFCHSQKEMKESYVKHIRLADSLYFDMVAYNKEFSFRSNELDAKILTDSMIKMAMIPNSGLSESQYKNLATIVSSHFENLQKLHIQYGEKLLHDSILLSAERQVLEGQTKTMLDLHLNKIEHEYSNITMWAAVLTILFLVFSFYSIFKMDELIQQGNQGIRDIRQLYNDGSNMISSITKDGNKALTDLTDKMRNQINEHQQILNATITKTTNETNNMNEQIRQANNNLAESLNSLDNIKEDYMKAVSEQVGQIEQKYDDTLKKKLGEIETLMESIRQFINKNNISQTNK